MNSNGSNNSNVYGKTIRKPSIPRKIENFRKENNNKSPIISGGKIIGSEISTVTRNYLNENQNQQQAKRILTLETENAGLRSVSF